MDKDPRDPQSGFGRLYVIQVLCAQTHLNSLTDLSRDLLFSAGMIRSLKFTSKLKSIGLVRSLLCGIFTFG